MSAPRAAWAALLVVALAGCQASSSPVPSGPPAPSASPAATASTAAPTPSPSAIPATPSETAAPAPGRWEPAGKLAASPIDPPTALLGDGRVLVLGTDDNSTPIAWLWDPVREAWTVTTGLPKSRSSFALVTLSDGRALAIGGLNDAGQSYSSTYAFDPASASWTKTVVLAAGRTEPTAVGLRDGRVLVMGGVFQNGSTSSLDRFVLASIRDAAGPVDGGSGLDDVDPPDRGPALATTELIDATARTVSAGPPMRFARAGALATLLSDGRVLVVGSIGPERGVRVDARAQTTGEVFDPATGTFALTGALPALDRAGLAKLAPPGANALPEVDPAIYELGTLVALPDGGAVLIAQHGSWKHVGDVSRSFRFDPASNGWTEIGPTYLFVGEPGPVPFLTPAVPSRFGAQVATLGDGRVLVAGGSGADELADGGGYQTRTLDTADLLDPASGSFRPAATMPSARAHGGVVVLGDGSVLLFGGFATTPDGGDAVPAAVRYLPGG
jgi:hypothetical protein